MSSRHLTLLLSLLVAALALHAPAAHAASPTPSLDAPRVEPGSAEGSDRGIRLSPIRFETQLADAGTELRYELRVTNATARPVQLSMDTLPLEGSDDPDVFARPAGAESRSAAATSWVQFPGFGPSRELAAGSTLRVPVRVRIPSDARPGTYALALAVTETISAPGVSTSDSARVRLGLAPATAIVVRVSGDAVAELRLRAVDTPRLVWGGAQRFRATVENVGDTELTIDAQVNLDGFLTAASRTLDARGPEKGFPTLPGGVRELEMRWSDPPLLGWFRPELVVVGGKGSGVRVTDQLPTVFVLPPWWLILLLLVALALPLRALWRRRRDEHAREARRERARARVEERLRRDEAKRRAAAARRRR